jgi:hypothetical protein
MRNFVDRSLRNALNCYGTVICASPDEEKAMFPKHANQIEKCGQR